MGSTIHEPTLRVHVELERDVLDRRISIDFDYSSCSCRHSGAIHSVVQTCGLLKIIISLIYLGMCTQ